MAAESIVREPVEAPPLVARLLRRVRPREGWLILILAWGATISLPAAASEGNLLAGIGVTFLISTLGLVFGWWAGHQRWRGGMVAAAAFLIGIAATLTWGVYVLNPLRSAWQIGRWLAWGLSCGFRPICELPAPALSALQEQAVRLADFGQRVYWWANGAITGRGIPDNLVLVGFAGIIAWCLAAWAGWWLARHGRVFLALVPTGFLLPQQVYNADAGHTWLLTFLAMLTLLLVLARLRGLEQAWDREGVDFSDELRVDGVLVAIALTALVLILSPLLPSLSPRAISEAFWRVFEAPYRQVEERVTRSFPGVETRRSFVPPLGVAAGGLPRAHLLGGRPELRDEIALRVQVRGARPGEGLYWRGQTFARYDGRGWGEDVMSALRPDEPLPLAPGQPWTTFIPPLRRNVLASVQVVEGTRAVLYAAGEPVSADRPYEVTLRAPGELVSLSAPGRPDRYTVLGAVAEVSPAALRTAGAEYPPEIIALYLQLPEDLPPGLAATAAEIAAGASTPYDKALSVEAALRKLPYTLDVPAPPQGREVVSWFLDEIQRGYCDYFATAMVVLARLNGVPARLAIGYASGTYDPGADRYEVNELDAHSWPELYFPGYGWIPFEPTPARATPVRTSVALGPTGALPPELAYADLDTGLAELRQLGEVQAAAAGRSAWCRRFLGGLNLLLGLGQALVLLRLRRRAWVEGADSDYDRLAAWGARLGRSAHAWETPREYAAAVVVAAEEIAAAARRDRAAASSASCLVRAAAPRLTEAFEAAQYAPSLSSSLTQETESRRWAALWAALRRLWVARWWR
jgi:transglutaminase-like putative cysteine protease